MTEYSHNLYPKYDSSLIDKFELMLKSRDAYFFDVEELEAIIDYYLDKTNYKKATMAVRHGLSIFPNATALLLRKAQICSATNQSKKALEILQYLEAAEPANTEMLLLKAVVHRKLDDYAGTKSCLLRALEVSPENRDQIFMDLAYEQQIASDYKGAIESIKESLNINPFYEAGLFEISYCYEMADEIENGIDFFEEYLEQHPYNYVGWYNLALCYDKVGLFEKSIDAIDFSIAIKEDFISGYILKGNVLTEMDMDVPAISAYEDSLKFDSENPMIYTAIGECQERLERWSHAELNYKKALAIDPEFIEALMGLGAINEHKGDLVNAITFYEEAVKKDDFHLDNRHILVEAYLKAQQFEKAKEHLEEMIKIFPDDADSWLSLAEITSFENNIFSLELIDRAIEKMPHETDLKWNKIKHLVRCGREQQAIDLYLHTSTVHPEGVKYFLTIFPEVLQFPNIASLIEIEDKAQQENEF